MATRRPKKSQFHVLRTYRRAAGMKRKAKVNANQGFLQKIELYVTKAKTQQKACENMSRRPSKSQLGTSPNV